MWIKFFWQVPVNTWIGKRQCEWYNKTIYSKKPHYVRLCNSELLIKWTALNTRNPFFMDFYFREYFFLVTNKRYVRQVRQVHDSEHLHCCAYSCMEFCITDSFHVIDSVCKVRDGCMPNLHLHCIKLVKHLN